MATPGELNVVGKIRNKWDKFSKGVTRKSAQDVKPGNSTAVTGKPAQDANTENFTVNDNVASSYGELKLKAHKDTDDELKALVAEEAKKIQERKDNGEDPDWSSVKELLSQSEALVPHEETEVNRVDEHRLSRTNVAKSTKNYRGTDLPIQGWLKKLIKNPDVLAAHAPVDEVISTATRASCGIGISKEEGGHDYLDIGFIRYPDITQPRIMVYFLKLHAWYKSKKRAGLNEDNNGIKGEFNAKTYRPNDALIKLLRENGIENALPDLESLF